MYFFADDFGAHLKTIYGNDFSLEGSQPETIKDVQDYIKKHYTLKINNEIIKLIKQDNSLTDNVFQIRFKTKRKITYIEGETEFSLKNTLLLEAFKDQSNIVRIDFKGDGNYETLEFENGNEVQKIMI
jgi:leucyl-tRNA synthetase